MSTLNEVESDEEKDKTQDQTPQIGSLQQALAAVKGVREYISSIDTTEYFINHTFIVLQRS